MTSNKPDCPYGADDCPKVREMKKKLEALGKKSDAIDWKVTALIILVVLLHGSEIAAGII